MAFKNIKEVMEHHVNVKVNKDFATAMVVTFQRFISRSESHNLFFNTPYVGVYPVRYLTSDALYFMEELMGIEDVRDLQRDIFKLDSCDRSHKVATDAVNLTYIYAAHLLMSSKLADKIKHLALIHTIAMGITKHLCSQVTRRFHFDADIQVAAMLFESLNNKTDLKRYGDWKTLLLARGDQFVDMKHGIHAKDVLYFTDDKRVQYATSDIQDRIVGVLNELTSKFHDIKDAQGKILSQSAMTSIDGEQVLRDYVRKETKLIDEMIDIAKDPRDLVRKDLVEMTSELLTTTDSESLSTVLNFYSDNWSASKGDHEEALRKLITYLIHEAKTSKLDLGDIPAVVKRVRSIFRHSRTAKPAALEIKKLFSGIIEEAIPRSRDAIKVSTTIGVVIYLTLRTLSIKHYR